VIIESQEDVTAAVLAEMHRTPDPRTREILGALVRHLHGFVREVRLTEREFQEAIRLLNAIGQHTTPSHNEAMLVAGALGVSNLVCLLNNGALGTRPTQANNLGPFWRMGWVRDAEGRAVPAAEVDVWQSSTVGLYENQDPTQAEMNLRGKLTTAADGSFGFRSVKPGAYPVPIEGPAGVLLAAQERHNWRPAHLHFLIFKPGFKTIASQVYTPDDPYLDTDSQFGVTRALIGNYVKHEHVDKQRDKQGPASAAGVDGPWWSLEHVFVLEPGEARLPQAPISAKVAAKGD
jgi:catechol 1,2-dioxygenase